MIAAYRAADDAFQAALRGQTCTPSANDGATPTCVPEADPALPALDATMTDPLLQTVRQYLVGDRNAGVVGTGSRTLRPRVVALGTTDATVSDCILDATKLIYAKTGQPVPPTPKVFPQEIATKATLVLIAGAWKEKTRTQTEGSCVSGS